MRNSQWTNEENNPKYGCCASGIKVLIEHFCSQTHSNNVSLSTRPIFFLCQAGDKIPEKCVQVRLLAFRHPLLLSHSTTLLFEKGKNGEICDRSFLATFNVLALSQSVLGVLNRLTYFWSRLFKGLFNIHDKENIKSPQVYVKCSSTI